MQLEFRRARDSFESPEEQGYVEVEFSNSDSVNAQVMMNELS